MKNLLLLFALISCATNGAKTTHGLLLFKESQKVIKKSDIMVIGEACNKNFLIFPYERNFQNQTKIFSSLIKSHKGFGLANVEMEEYYYTNFILSKTCQKIKGYLLIEDLEP